MASRKIEEVMEKLNQVIKKQEEYENKFLNKDQGTASVSFTGSNDNCNMEQEQQLLELSTVIESIKDEVGRLAEMMEKHEQDLDDLEQYGRSNCLILHGNNIDNRISNEDCEGYVIATINSRLDLSVPISKLDIDVCHPLPSKNNKKPIIIKFVRRSIRNMIYANKKKLKTTEGPKLSITESLTKRRLKLLEEARNAFEFKNVWTMKGTVYCAFKGKKFAIKKHSDISSIRLLEIE